MSFRQFLVQLWYTSARETIAIPQPSTLCDNLEQLLYVVLIDI